MFPMPRRLILYFFYCLYVLVVLCTSLTYGKDRIQLMRILSLRHGAFRSRAHVQSGPFFHTSTTSNVAGTLDPRDLEASDWHSAVGETSNLSQLPNNELKESLGQSPSQSWHNGIEASSSTFDSSQPPNTLALDAEDPATSVTVLSPYAYPITGSFRSPPASRIPYFREDVCTPEAAKSKVRRALQQKKPYVLMPALLRALHDPTFVPSLPATTFHEIIRFLDPKYFLQDLKHIHREFHPAQIRIYGNDEPHIQEIFDDYEAIVDFILHNRARHGRRLGLEEYRILLKALSHTGNGKAAYRVWVNMNEESIEPDLDCYNSYYQARCWSNAYHPAERFKLRVIPMTMKYRQAPLGKLSRRLPGYSVGRGGLKATISETFVDMIEQGIMADAIAFSLLMTGLAKEGDLAGVKSILKQVWDVDADSPADMDEDPQMPNGLACESPLYPNEQVLWTIADIFGSNNDIPAALRVVDYVSRRYSIPISTRVWGVLLEWTYVLSQRRSNGAVSGLDWTGIAQGQLPLRSVESLWNTMISEPYSIEPTMGMYDRYIRNLRDRDMLDAFVTQASKGLSLYWSSFRRYAKLITLHQSGRKITGPDNDTMSDIVHASPDQSPLASSLLNSHDRKPDPDSIRYEETVLRLELVRQFATISRWVRLLLGGTRWYGKESRIFQWERRILPDVIRRLWLFRPDHHIRYKMSTGHVILTGYRGAQPLRYVTRSKFGLFHARMRKYLQVTRGKCMRQLRSSERTLRCTYDHSMARTNHNAIIKGRQPKLSPTRRPTDRGGGTLKRFPAIARKARTQKALSASNLIVKAYPVFKTGPSLARKIRSLPRVNPQWSCMARRQRRST